MSLARYAAKLAAMLNSSGQVPAAGIAPGAAGVLAWVALGNSGGSTPWVKLCTINGSQNDRGTIMLSGSYGYGAPDDLVAGGAVIHYTIGNTASQNNLNCHVINSSANPFIVAAYAVRVGNDYTWDLWVQANVYERINCCAFGNLYTITNTYTDVTQASKPTGGYDKKVGRAVTSLTPGAVLQVVQNLIPGADATARSTILATTSTSYSSIITQAITTTMANSKILVSAQTGAYNGSAQRGATRLVRNSTVLDANQYAIYDQGGVFDFHNFTVLDAPSVAVGTTLTYYYQGRSASGLVNFGYGDSGGGPGAQITLMEIAT